MRRRMAAGKKQQYTLVFDGIYSGRLLVNSWTNHVTNIVNGRATWKAKPYTEPITLYFAEDTQWKALAMNSGETLMAQLIGADSKIVSSGIHHETKTITTFGTMIIIGIGSKSFSRTYRGVYDNIIDLTTNPIKDVACKYVDTNESYSLTNTPYKIIVRDLLPDARAFTYINGQKAIQLHYPFNVTYCTVGSVEFEPSYTITFKK